MKKLVFCSVTMKPVSAQDADRAAYKSNNQSFPVSDRAVTYPINAYLEKTLMAEDELKVVMLVKRDKVGNYQINAQRFQQELLAASEGIGAKIEFVTIETDFEEERAVHEQLLGRIIAEIGVGDHIVADITYGPKDQTVLFFAALNFASKFLSCEVDRLIYGQVDFVNQRATNHRICDVTPLYYFNSVIQTMPDVEPEQAKKLLQMLLSL